MLGITKEEILAAIEKILKAIKDAFKWLGILVLPEEGEIPGAGKTE